MFKLPALPTWLFATLAAFVVSLSAAVKLLLLLMLLDFISGLVCAVKEKKLSSDKGRDGLRKKAMTLILVAAVHLAASYGGIGFDLGSVVAMAYAINELISIAENAARAGVGIPPQLLEFVEKAQKMTGKGEGAERRVKDDPNFAGPDKRVNGTPPK